MRIRADPDPQHWQKIVISILIPVSGNPPSRSSDPYIEPAIFVYRNGADSSRRGLPIWVNPEFSVADPDPGSGGFFTPGSRIRIPDPDPRWEKSGIRDEDTGSHFRELRNIFLG